MSIWSTVGGFDADGEDSETVYVGVATSGFADQVRLSVGLGAESALIELRLGCEVEFRVPGTHSRPWGTTRPVARPVTHS